MRNTKKKTMSEQLEELDRESQADDLSLWGMAMGGQPSSVINSPKFQSIVAALTENPILVAPTLAWLQEKRAAIARAQLQTLYTSEELEAMYDSVRKD